MRLWNVSFTCLLACSGAIRRPLVPTEAATALEQVTRSKENELAPAVSPDGRWLAYEVASTADALSRVEVVGLPDLEPARPARPVYSTKDTQAAFPTWMPDSSGIVFVSRTARSARGLLQTMGKSPRETNFVAEAGDPYLSAEWPAVAPDGRSLAVTLVNASEYRSGWREARTYDNALGLSDLLGSGVTLLGAGSSPAFSPDGRSIAFSRSSAGHAHLFVMSADGSGEPVQITVGPEDDLEPRWSPDGKCLVFASAHATDDRYVHANLFVVASDGSGLVQLTEGDRLSSRPSWGKDGRVYFQSNATGSFHIWRLEPRGIPCEARRGG